MSELPITGRHETVLHAEPDDVVGRSELAAGLPAAERLAALRAVVADHPSSPTAWAALAAAVADPVERYAYARVGYHRGLDALRANGWGGVGLVRWERPTNRGFLRALVLLREAARAIDEESEVDRIDAFLRDLDPAWDDARVDR